MVRVLVVEDEANIRDMIALNLRHAGMEVVEAESAEAALPLLALAPPSPTKLSTRQTQKLRQYRPCSACLALDFKSSRVHISVYLPISYSIFPAL